MSRYVQKPGSNFLPETDPLPPIEGFRTEDLEELSIKEAAYHTKSSRFYKLVAHTARGWPFPFDDLHHRKCVIVNVGIFSPNAREEIAILKRISDEISPLDGTQILAFPSDEFGRSFSEGEFVDFFTSCGVHPNDQSFKLMAKARVDGPEPHPVFAYLKLMGNVPAVGADFGAYFVVTRNSHLKGVARNAAAVLEVLEREQTFGVADKYRRKAAPPGKSYSGMPSSAE